MPDRQVDAAPRKARLLAWRLAFLYGAVFFTIGVQLPYMPVWLDWRGLDATEIGLIMAAPLFGRILITPLLGFAGDRFGSHGAVIILAGCAALVAALALGQSRLFAPIFVASALFTMALASLIPLTDWAAMSSVRAYGIDYGRVRLAGSLTFIAASLLGGALIGALNAEVVAWLMMAGAAAVAMAAYALVRTAAFSESGAREVAEKTSIAGAFRLLREPVFLLFLLASGSVQATHAVLYAFGTLHWRAQGLPPVAAGLLWTIGVVVEIGVFAFSTAIVRKFGPLRLVAMGAAAAVARWGTMAFDPALPVLCLLQALHGLTFAAAHLGAVHFVARAVPRQLSATAQAVHSTVSGGIGMGLAMLAAGNLFAAYGGKAYLAMSLLGAVGLAASLATMRLWTGGELGGEVQR